MFIFPVIVVDSLKGLLAVATKVMGDTIAEVPTAGRVSVERGSYHQNNTKFLNPLTGNFVLLEAEIAQTEAIIQKVLARFAESKIVRNPLFPPGSLIFFQTPAYSKVDDVNQWTVLPREMAIEIFSKLDSSTLLRCRAVCKTWQVPVSFLALQCVVLTIFHHLQHLCSSAQTDLKLPQRCTDQQLKVLTTIFPNVRCIVFPSTVQLTKSAWPILHQNNSAPQFDLSKFQDIKLLDAYEVRKTKPNT